MKFLVALVLSVAACVLGSALDEPINPSFDAIRDVRFLLTTRENRGNPIQVRLGDLNSILQSPYRRERALRISIHGWNANENDGTHLTISRVLLDRDDFNFIFIDWSAANSISYVTSRNRVPDVGVAVAAFIDWLNDNDLLDINRVKIIGFSLGAHVAGMTGKRVRGGKVNSIIGLDPAGPLFSVNNPTERLAAGDAEYVEAIHTNGGTLANGIGAPIADADFFPNGGSTQPGCDSVGCSHTRAVSFYVESITNNRFWALRCATAADAANGNCNSQPGTFMGGEPSNYGLRGIFHLTTNAVSPFGRGQ